MAYLDFMKTLSFAIVSVVSALMLGACTTVVGPDGRERQVMTPMGAGIVQTFVSAGVGAGTGALMRNSPGWATGAVAGGGGSVVSQVVNSFIPQAGPNYRPAASQPVYCGVDEPVFSGQGNSAGLGYGQGYNTPAPQQHPSGQQVPLYYRRPDGSFAPVQ